MFSFPAPASTTIDPEEGVWRRRALMLLLLAVALGVGLRVKQYAQGHAYWHDEASLLVNIFEVLVGAEL